MSRLVAFALVMTAFLGGCGFDQAPQTSAAPPEPAILLRRLVDGTGCDLIGIDYRRITFRVDVIEPVWAETERGVFLHTYWSSGFVGGTAADRVVRDPQGRVMARNGEVLAIPDGGWPEFGGYFVCPQPRAVYFFDHPAP